MFRKTLDKTLTNRLKEMIDNARNIVITCHLTPDGDAMGSSLGLQHYLRNKGKHAVVITPDMPSKSLLFIPGAHEIKPLTTHPQVVEREMNDADLIFCLDYNDSSRVDRLEPLLIGAKAPKVMIDHHTHPSSFPTLLISDPTSSSTCLLLLRVIEAMDGLEYVDHDAAEAIYTGMMTDTGNFSYNSLDPDIYIAIAELLSRNIDKDRIYKLAFNTKSESQLRLNGFAIAERMRVFPEHSTALIWLSASDLERFGYRQGDTEGLVNVPLSVPEIKTSIYLREHPDYIKVSMRSEGSIPVNRFCTEWFGGGGHINAAGGEFKGTMEECIQRVEEALPIFFKSLETTKI